MYCLFVCLHFYNNAQLVTETMAINMGYVEEDVHKGRLYKGNTCNKTLIKSSHKYCLFVCLCTYCLFVCFHFLYQCSVGP